MKNNFWSRLESLSGGGGLLADWQSTFGPEFALALPFLKVTHRRAQSYPCPGLPPCGCRHVVRETSQGLQAVCLCEPPECDPIPVEPGALMIHILDRWELGKTICRAL